MKQVCVQLSLVALLLAAITVPVVESGTKTADARKPSAAAESRQVASGLPVPWCKDGKCAAVAEPRQVASGSPVPWCKDGKCAAVAEPRQMASGLPVPWCKDGKCAAAESTSLTSRLPLQGTKRAIA